jgi:tetratricopeptide (TPR) repeat protein
MRDTQQPSSTELLPQKLKEIGGYVAAILLYILAIIGQPPEPFASYPSTISLLTIFISVGALWLWRWPKLDIGERSRTKRLGKAETVPWQRRLELALLLSLTLLSIGRAIVKSRAAAQELSGFVCESERSDAPVIIIANFAADTTEFGNSLTNAMNSRIGDRFRICKYNRTINLGSEAIEIGKREEAMLVIWGNRNADISEVYLTAIKWQMLNKRDETILVDGGQNALVLLTENIIAEILFAQGLHSEAQRSIGAALMAADTRGMSEKNATLMSSSYFLFGLLSDPNQLPEQQLAKPKQAIFAYSRAIELNGAFESAYINRAALYELEGESEKAIADCRVLIERDKASGVEARLMRGQIYLDQQRYTEAIADFEAARDSRFIYPEHYLYSYVVHSLSKAYLLHGDYMLGEQNYQKLILLSGSDAEEFISDLEQSASKIPLPEGKDTIVRMIAYIKQIRQP